MAGGRRVRTKTRRSPLIGLLVLLIVIVLTLGAALILLSTWEQRKESEPEKVTIGGQQVEINPTLPQSELEQAHFTKNEDGSITYSGAARYGIDVSAHQGEIDWAAVAGDGVEFAFLRIGYRGYSAGALNLDGQFEANYAGAREQGIDVGVYFFSQAISEEEAREEARQVLSWLEGKEIQCPIVYDWEHIEEDTARTDSVDGETVTACARAFCEEIREAGYDPMIYCNGMLGYLSYDLTQLEDYPLWYAEYEDYPSYAYEVTIWQYTESGTVAGIQGKSDRNIWFQTEEKPPET